MAGVVVVVPVIPDGGLVELASVEDGHGVAVAVQGICHGEPAPPPG